MLILPGSQFVGITSERARYHAVRMNLHISRETPHQQLYDLVDVIYMDRQDAAVISKTNYRFSGYTLSDEHWLKKLSPQDRACLADWLTQSEARNEIEGARRKLIYDDLPDTVQLFSYPGLLHSTLYDLIQSLPLTIAKVKQWYGTIMNLQKAGVRREELKWSGLTAYFNKALQEPDKRINKQDILAVIDFSPIRLELSNELIRDDNNQLGFTDCGKRLSLETVWKAGIDACCTDRAVLRYRNDIFNYRIAYLKASARYSPLIGDKRWFALDAYGHALTDKDSNRTTFDSIEDVKRLINRHAAQNYGLKSSLISKSRYQYISLHGGDDYREWLLTLPDYPFSFYSPHFTARNMLLHIRTKLRHDAQQRKLLFIEEIQSDWHQPPTKKHNSCYRELTPPAPFRTEWVTLALKLMLIHAVKEGYAGLSWADGALQETRYDEEIHAVKRLYDKTIPRQLMQLARPWQGSVATGVIETKYPWLRIARVRDKWQVKNEQYGFITRLKKTREEAVSIAARHSRSMSLQVPVFLIPADMARHIHSNRLPLFGASMV